MDLNWPLPPSVVPRFGGHIAGFLTEIIEKHYPDLRSDFPRFESIDHEINFFDSWFAARITDLPGAGMANMGEIPEPDRGDLVRAVTPFEEREHRELARRLDERFFRFDRFTYVGPHSGTHASWSDVATHFCHWLEAYVVPEVMKRNRQRIMRVLPRPPAYDLEVIQNSLWVLECEATLRQGSAFVLDGVGMVTCHHVLGTATKAFRSQDAEHSYPIEVVACDESLDLAVLRLMGGTDPPINNGLLPGSADALKELDHLAIAGFPNYYIGSHATIVPGVVVGFRPVRGIRRILTNALIVSGNSGGPVVDSVGKVIGIAATGADLTDRKDLTDLSGIIPIEALTLLRVTEHRGGS